MSNYENHPAANVFPMLSADELQELGDDIKENGLQKPIELVENQVIDGRNRQAACKLVGVTPKYIEIEIKDPIKYVISLNIHRRHLTTAQRAAIAAELANLEHGSNQRVRKEEGQNCPSSSGTSIKEAAALMNVSPRSVKNAKKLMQENPQAHEDAKAGKKAPKTKKQRVRHNWANRAIQNGLPDASGGNKNKCKKEIEQLLGYTIPSPLRDEHLNDFDAACVRLVAQRKGADPSKILDEEIEELKETFTKKKDETALNKAIKAVEKKAKIEFDQAVEEKVAERVTPIYETNSREFNYYKKITDAYKGVLSFTEYRKLIGFIHPDRNPGRESEAAELYKLLVEKEDVLCGVKPKERDNRPGALPPLDEILKRQGGKPF